VVEECILSGVRLGEPNEVEGRRPFDFVRTTAAELDRSTGMLVGAGSGSWDSPVYLERLSLEPSIDLVNIHVYPLSNGFTDYLRRTAETAEQARARGKKVIIGEAWLYKATPQELAASIAYTEVLARDPYLFWQPLDIRFVETIAGLAEEEHLEYVSFFWSGYFFDYLAYDDALPRLAASNLFQRLNQAQFAKILAGELSPTGVAFQFLVRTRP